MNHDFPSRVNYAVQCFKVGSTGGRKFDSCFEMYDGKYVVTAIVRRARKDPKFESKLKSHLNQVTWDKWQETADKFSHLSNKELKAEADKTRLAAIEESERRYNEYLARNGEKEQF